MQSHLVAYAGNDAELLPCALFQARLALYMRDPEHPDGFGLGFIQGEEVLLQKKPRPEHSEVDFYALARDLRADALVGRAGLDPASIGAAQNADPFRFRTWLFGMIGDAPSFEGVRERLLENVPDFLRRNIRGQSFSEHIFHLFLAFLHDGGLLDIRAPALPVIQKALHQSIAFADHLLADGGSGPSPLPIVVTNGRALVANTRGIPLQYLDVVGLPDCSNPTCPIRRGLSDQQRRITHPDLRAVVLEADRRLKERPGWRRVPENHSLLASLSSAPEIRAN